jgi:hypothetical protein
MLFGLDVPRIRIFERVGAGEILDMPVHLDLDYLERLKREQINFLSKALT